MVVTLLLSYSNNWFTLAFFTMESNSYTFVYVPDKVCKTLETKDNKDLLMKWSMKGNLQVQYYSFNQPFITHRKEDFVKSFFADPVVFSSLVYNGAPIGRAASNISFDHIPCTVLSMEFFDRLVDPENKIVRCDGKTIVQCLEENVKGFFIEDNLRNVILNEESESFNLYSESERRQFLWELFCHLCLGGEWCQYEFTIETYLNLAKELYKELVSVERVGDSNELVIRSVVLKAQAFDKDRTPLAPTNPDNPQNFVYLIVDPFKRSVAVLSHVYGGCFSD